MFSRGNWAIFNLDPNHCEVFRNSIKDPYTMTAVSQFAAAAIAETTEIETFGIAPYAHPRLDEKFALNHTSRMNLIEFMTTEKSDRKKNPLPALELAGGGKYEIPYGEDTFSITGNIDSKIFGLWFITNEAKDILDTASIREGKAYDAFGTPYKLLSKADKTQVDEDIHIRPVIKRTQFPIIVDFMCGHLFVENTNKTVLENVMRLMENLGAPVIPVAWQFKHNWVEEFLGKVYNGSEYSDLFYEYAKAVGTGSEKLMEEQLKAEGGVEKVRTLKNFFASYDNEGYYLALTTPAKVRLGECEDTASLSSVTGVTAVMRQSDSSFRLRSANVTFRYEDDSDVEAKMIDELSLELSDQINLTEVGAALLRGYDAHRFKRMTGSYEGRTPSKFWMAWRSYMLNSIDTITIHIASVLNLDVDAVGIVPLSTEELTLTDVEE